MYYVMLLKLISLKVKSIHTELKVINFLKPCWANIRQSIPSVCKCWMIYPARCCCLNLENVCDLVAIWLYNYNFYYT